MSATNVLLAKPWTPDIDPTGWWMSEKLDGVRALWDGTKFVSRLGNAFAAPSWYTKLMPKVVLDGELWCGRGAFQDTVSIVRSSTDKGWNRVLYRIFDAPDAPGGFEDRLGVARREYAKHGCPNVSLLEQTCCKGRDHLAEVMTYIVLHKGEGVMLRRAGSLYERKRASSLLKVKLFHDAEARVTGYQPGEGKHRGRLGALELVSPEGVRFKVGTGFSDAEREDPPAVGSVVTYSYQELTRDGVPRFPAFVAVRDYEAARGGSRGGSR